eukprot:scaffold168744_cov37-Tisochrysis_lutea.AAC.4
MQAAPHTTGPYLTVQAPKRVERAGLRAGRYRALLQVYGEIRGAECSARPDVACTAAPCQGPSSGLHYVAICVQSLCIAQSPMMGANKSLRWKYNMRRKSSLVLQPPTCPRSKVQRSGSALGPCLCETHVRTSALIWCSLAIWLPGPARLLGCRRFGYFRRMA